MRKLTHDINVVEVDLTPWHKVSWNRLLLIHHVCSFWLSLFLLFYEYWAFHKKQLRKEMVLEITTFQFVWMQKLKNTLLLFKESWIGTRNQLQSLWFSGKTAGLAITKLWIRIHNGSKKGGRVAFYCLFFISRWSPFFVKMSNTHCFVYCWNTQNINETI